MAYSLSGYCPSEWGKVWWQKCGVAGHSQEVENRLNVGLGKEPRILEVHFLR